MTLFKGRRINEMFFDGPSHEKVLDIETFKKSCPRLFRRFTQVCAFVQEAHAKEQIVAQMMSQGIPPEPETLIELAAIRPDTILQKPFAEMRSKVLQSFQKSNGKDEQAAKRLNAIHNLEKGKRPYRGNRRKVPSDPVVLSKEFLYYYKELRKLKTLLDCPKADAEGRITLLRRDLKWRVYWKRMTEIGINLYLRDSTMEDAEKVTGVADPAMIDEAEKAFLCDICGDKPQQPRKLHAAVKIILAGKYSCDQATIGRTTLPGLVEKLKKLGEKTEVGPRTIDNILRELQKQATKTRSGKKRKS